jgi:6,7-dimethyl-8-ribityllumazine synthase
MMAKGNDAVDFPELDGETVRVGIIKARLHDGMVDALVADVKAAITALGVQAENVIESEVPDAFQLPIACRFLSLSQRVDVIIPVGILIQESNESSLTCSLLADSVTKSLMSVGLNSGTPVINGCLPAATESQAKDLAAREGAVLGKSAVEMALLRMSVIGKKGTKNFLGFGDPEPETTGSETPPGEKKKIGF